MQFNSVIFDSSTNKPATVHSDCDGKAGDTKRNNYDDIEIFDLIWFRGIERIRQRRGIFNKKSEIAFSYANYSYIISKYFAKKRKKIR